MNTAQGLNESIEQVPSARIPYACKENRPKIPEELFVKAGQLASADMFYKLLGIDLLELQAGLMGLRYFLVPTDFCKGR